MGRIIIAQATVSNGRWEHQAVLVSRDVDGQFRYHDGHSDPLICPDEATAMRFFNERVSRAA